MPKSLFSHEPDYLICLRGIHQLHALAIARQDQSDDANRIRTDMEKAWWNLSAEEQERLDGLSADLYDISDSQQPPHPTLVMDSDRPRLNQKLVEVSRAQDEGDWDQALEILREIKGHLKAPRLAYWRGRIWEDAGDNETADLFLQHASATLADFPLTDNPDLLDVKFHFRSKSLLPTGTC